MNISRITGGDVQNVYFATFLSEQSTRIEMKEKKKRDIVREKRQRRSWRLMKVDSAGY